jgi:hypothetical protein
MPNLLAEAAGEVERAEAGGEVIEREVLASHRGGTLRPAALRMPVASGL